MRYAKTQFYLLGILLVIVMFQNCGLPSRLQSGTSLFSNDASGNGGGYEGKPDGTFYHFIPSHTCEGKPQAQRVAEIKNGQAYLYDNSDKQCADQGAPIAVGDINISPFQNEFISVKDALFKRYDVKPEGIPQSLAEILCRDDFENPTMEIVSHYDREKNEALARVYTLDQQIPDFAVSRILSSSQVRYVSSTLTFKVDLSKPAFAERKFAGVLEKASTNGLTTQPLVCVIGGSVDTSKWALKSLTDIDVGGFQILSNNEIVFFSEVYRHYFSPTLYQTVTNLFKIDSQDVVSNFSKPVFGENYDVHFRGAELEGYLYFYHAKLRNEGYRSQFVYNLKTNKAKRLTNLNGAYGSSWEEFGLFRPAVTADGYVFYDTRVVSGASFQSWILRVYNINDDSIEDLIKVDERVGVSYTVLPKSNKAVFFRGPKDGYASVIEVYDAKMKKYSDLALQIGAGCQPVVVYEATLTADETEIITEQICDQKKFDVVRISLLTGQVKVIAENSRIEWKSKDGNRILNANSTSKSYSAYDIRTGKKVALPIDPYMDLSGGANGYTSFAYSDDKAKLALAQDRFIYGLGGVQETPTMFKVDLDTGTSVPVCESAVGRKIFVGRLPNDKVFLFTYDKSVKVYRFYQAKSETDCSRINEFPSEYPNIPQLMATNIGFGVLLGNPLTVYETNVKAEAVFVPIDGRPPMKLNASPNPKSEWSMAVSADKNRIVLQGPDIKNVIRIFSFDL